MASRPAIVFCLGFCLFCCSCVLVLVLWIEPRAFHACQALCLPLSNIPALDYLFLWTNVRIIFLYNLPYLILRQLQSGEDSYLSCRNNKTMELKIKCLFQEISPSDASKNKTISRHLVQHTLNLHSCHDFMFYVMIVCVCVFNYLETLFTKEAPWGLM